MRHHEDLKRLIGGLLTEIGSGWFTKSSEKQKVVANVCDFQRKFEVELANEFEKIEYKPELIIVASFVEKMPNLGGLARTCEVAIIICRILVLHS